MTPIKIGILAFGSGIILWFSRQNLLHPKHHGFYRFLAWQTILVAFVINVDFWFVDPLSLAQVAAWTLLVISLVLILIAVRAFRKIGEIDRERSDPGLVGIEKTTQLVTTGIYHFIRHPFYASLLFLSWGIFFKHITPASVWLTILATIFLFITARIEESENVAFFGQPYRDYMKTTKRFIPFVL